MPFEEINILFSIEEFYLEAHKELLAFDKFIYSLKDANISSNKHIAIIEKIIKLNKKLAADLRESEFLIHELKRQLEETGYYFISNKSLFRLIKARRKISSYINNRIYSFAVQANVLSLNFAIGIFKKPDKPEFAIESETERKFIVESADQIRLFAASVRKFCEITVTYLNNLKQAQ